jgi:hypothetical protein
MPTDILSKLQGSGLLRRYTDLPAVIDVLTNRRIVFLDPTSWDDRNDAHFVLRYKTEARKGIVLALCFTTKGETYHHWRVFCGSKEGVCIQFHGHKLLDVVKKEETIRADYVRYMTIKQIKNSKISLPQLPFIKRHSFRDDSEFRIIYERNKSSEQSGEIEKGAPATHEVKIPLDVIRTITLNPWLPKSLFDATRDLLKSIPGCENIRVTRSQLTDNSSWKMEADRFNSVK